MCCSIISFLLLMCFVGYLGCSRGSPKLVHWWTLWTSSKDTFCLTSCHMTVSMAYIEVRLVVLVLSFVITICLVVVSLSVIGCFDFVTLVTGCVLKCYWLFLVLFVVSLSSSWFSIEVWLVVFGVVCYYYHYVVSDSVYWLYFLLCGW